MKKHLLFFYVLFSVGNLYASVSPLAVSTFPVFQFPPQDYTITGARLSLFWGRHENVYGLDLGLIGNITTKSFAGLGLSGAFNKTNDSVIVGLQLAGITNVNVGTARILGLQAAFICNYNARGDHLGLQLSATNISPGMNIYGVQLAGFNKANEVFGVQIGFVNIAKSLHGLQIGLLNFNHDGPLAFFPIVNVGI